MSFAGNHRLRLRLALKQTVWFTAVVSLVAWGVYAILANRLADALDDELQDRSIAVRSMMQVGDGRVTWLHQQADPEVREQFEKSIHDYQLLDNQGHVLGSAGQFVTWPIEMSLSPDTLAQVANGHQAWEVFTPPGGSPIRVYDLLVAGPEHRYVLRLGMSLHDVQQAQGRVALVAVVIVPILVLIQIIIWWLVSGPALRPLGEINAAVQRITPRTLDRRLPVWRTGDELEQLGAALNSMISGFQTSFQRMSRVLTDLSHELRQPLMVLRAETEQALQTRELGDIQRKSLVKQLGHVEHLSRTLTDMMELAQADCAEIHIQRQPENLSELVKAAVDGIQSNAGQILIAANLQEDVIVEIDTGQIWRLLLNLLENGVKFNRPGGRVDVVLTAHQGWAVVSVTDTGCGVPPEEQALIFDRSYRSSAARQSGVPGSGLGLHFAQSIAQAHGGRIELTSVPGEGSSFRVFLPMVTMPVRTLFTTAEKPSSKQPSSIQ